MARQSEFPRLKRWSRAVLAVVWAGLVLAASPALGKWYNIPSVSVEQASIFYRNAYSNGELNIYGEFGLQLPSNRGPFRDENIPVYPLVLRVAWANTFSYTSTNGWSYSDPPCFVNGPLVNIFGGPDAIFLWVSKFDVYPGSGFYMYRLGVSFFQQWHFYGYFWDPCSGVFDLQIASFKTVDYHDLLTLEEVNTNYNGVLGFQVTDAIPGLNGDPGSYFSTWDARLNVESVNSEAPVIYATAGANGTTSPAGAVQVNNGASKAFTITPAVNYHVADVRVDGASVGAVTTYTFVNVTADHTIAATFGAGPGPTTISILTDKDKVRVPPGKTAPLQVKLSGAPATNVQVTVVRQSGSTALSIQGPATLTFTPAKWNTYQTVQIAATPGKTDMNATAVFQLSGSGLTGKQVSAVKGTGGIGSNLLLLLIN